MEKVVLISLHQKWIGLAVMGKYHSIPLMLFNLAFLMKCKYCTITFSAVISHVQRTFIIHFNMNYCGKISNRCKIWVCIILTTAQNRMMINWFRYWIVVRIQLLKFCISGDFKKIALLAFISQPNLDVAKGDRHI